MKDIDWKYIEFLKAIERKKLELANPQMIKQIMWFVLGISAFILFVAGMYWLVKNVSYWIFYEDMVRETIIQMVKPEYLNDR